MQLVIYKKSRKAILIYCFTSFWQHFHFYHLMLHNAIVIYWYAHVQHLVHLAFQCFALPGSPLVQYRLCSSNLWKIILSFFLTPVPIMSHGPSFNFSIWFVELQGMNDQEIVEPSLAWFNTVSTCTVVCYA